jgi:hypothetical protein
MAEERDSGWVSGGLVDAEDARYATGMLVTPSETTGLGYRYGRIPGPGARGLVSIAGTPSGSVVVNPFQAVIPGAQATGRGPYLVTLAEPKTIDVLQAVPPDPAGERVALIIAQQTDTQYGDLTTAFEVRVVGGAPAVTDDPVIQGAFLPLARIRIAKNATSLGTVEDLRAGFTCAVGGVLPVRNANDRPVNAFAGQYVHRLDTGHLECYDGGGWRTVDLIDTGWQAVTAGPDWFPRLLSRPSEGFPPILPHPAPEVRMVGPMVYVSGQIDAKVGIADGSVVFTFPDTRFLPRADRHFVGMTGDHLIGLRVSVSQNAVVVAYATPSITANTRVSVDGSWLVG